jgi:hypothetical protein
VLTHLLIASSILLRWGCWLAVAAVIRRLRRGRGLVTAVLLRGTVPVSIVQRQPDAAQSLTEHRSYSEADSPGVGRNCWAAGHRSFAVRRCTAGLGSKTWCCSPDAVARVQLGSLNRSGRERPGAENAQVIALCDLAGQDVQRERRWRAAPGRVEVEGEVRLTSVQRRSFAECGGVL